MDISIAEERFYVFDERLRFDEDGAHEFKGHRNFSVEELPPWCFLKNKANHVNNLKRSRRAISRTLCGYMNTQEGGTVYLGVTDEGLAKGMRMALYQRDHLVISLQDLLSRFTPACPEDRIKVRFVPVLAPQESLKSWMEKLSVADASMVKSSAGRTKPHSLRSYEYCWCDIEGEALYDCSEWLPTFIPEITVKQRMGKPEILVPAESNWPQMRPIYKADIMSIYEDEERKCYCRGQGGLHQYPVSEVWSTTQLLVSSHYLPIIEDLRASLTQARLLFGSQGQATDEEFRQEVLSASTNNFF